MSKKSNPEKGLRTVDIDFAGKTGTLKFSHSLNSEFEAAANRILRSDGLVSEGMIFVEGLMSQWIGNAKVFSLALYYGFNKELSLKEIDTGIDEYIQAGGAKLDLTRSIIRAFKMATDPSSLALTERNWKASDERQSILSNAELDQMEAVEMAIAEVKAKMTGLPSNDLPASN